MLKKLSSFIQSLSTNRPELDPSRFNDPIALLTEWGPLVKGGSNFCTQKLVELSPTRIEFKATLSAHLFSSAFWLGGLIVVWIAFMPVLRGEAPLGGEHFFTASFSLIFISAGVWLFLSMTKPIVFDMLAGYFWKGRVAPHQTFHQDKIKVMTPLENLHALQIISEHIRGNKSSYYSYELNLVLGDGKRLNVVDHGSYRKLRADADHLSRFLGVPLWDVAR